MVEDKNEIMRDGNINYRHVEGSKVIYKPWLGDLFSFMYDSIMEKSVFPKKFEASIKKHSDFLSKEYSGIHNSRVLELGTGSGNISELLPPDNEYAGIDISPGLLKKAYLNLINAGFSSPELFICSAINLPFQEDYFDFCLCNLSLNFFPHVPTAVKEVKKTLKPGGTFICSVPVPERNRKGSIIRGELHSEKELEEILSVNGFEFTSYGFTNGALLYFRAIKS